MIVLNETKIKNKVKNSIHLRVKSNIRYIFFNKITIINKTLFYIYYLMNINITLDAVLFNIYGSQLEK